MRPAHVRADVLAEGPGGVVVGLRWQEAGRPKAIELFQVLRLRDGKVVDMEDFDRRHWAFKAAGAAP